MTCGMCPSWMGGRWHAHRERDRCARRGAARCGDREGHANVVPPTCRLSYTQQLIFDTSRVNDGATSVIASESVGNIGIDSTTS
jgi:hypothetical protein